MPGQLKHVSAGTANITVTYLGGGNYSATITDTVHPDGWAPKYTLPTGYVYQPGTGGVMGTSFVRTEAAWNALPGASGTTIDPSAYPSANVFTLSDSGNRSTNRNTLQAQVTAAYARAGHTLLFLDGNASEWASSDGQINVPAPSGANDGTSWCVIAPKMMDPAFYATYGVQFPRATDVRLQNGDETGLPKFSVLLQPGTGGQRPYDAFILAAGTRRFAVVGCEFRYDPSFNPGTDTSGSPGLQEGFISPGTAFPNSAAYPDYVVIDRCALHGEVNVAITRALYLGGHHIALTNSRVYNIGASQGDSQGFVATTGAGPYLIQNNYIGVGWGENVFFGGGGCLFESEIPSDIVVLGNTLDQPPALKAAGYDTKNLLEFKVGHRVLVTGNRFTNYIGDGQYGGQYYPICIKAISQNDGDFDADGTWWDLTHDVTIWGNTLDNCNAFMELSDASQNYGSPNFHRIEVAHNLQRPNDAGYANIRSWVLSLGGADYGIADWATNPVAEPRDVVMHHNTLFLPSGANALAYFAASLDRPTTVAAWIRNILRDNVIVFASGVSGPYITADAAGADRTHTKIIYDAIPHATSIWGPNAIVASGVTTNPCGDTGHFDVLYPDTTTAGVNSDGTLTSGSPLLTAAHDGGAMGADISYVTTATAHAATGL